MRRSLGWITVLSLALAFATADAARPRGPIEIWQTAEVEIAADGRVTRVRWLDERPVAQLIGERIEPHVRTWQFEPGRINGEPQATRTYLTAQLLGEVRGDQVALRFGRVSTGPHATHKVIPRYPESAARAGVSAKVTAVLNVTPDGRVTFESLDFWRPDNRTARQDEFIEATRSALAQWKYAPEQVGSHDVPPQVRVPVEFCAPGANCEKLFRPARRDGLVADSERPGEAVALNSAVRLLTPVEGDAI